MTPEGKVKKKLNKILDARRPFLYYHMPVPTGYGRSSLDYLGFYWGRGFAIETKRAGKDLTERQKGTRDDIEASGTPVFRVRDDDELAVFVAWLDQVSMEAMRNA